MDAESGRDGYGDFRPARQMHLGFFVISEAKTLFLDLTYYVI
jgi:hypothetical protein